MNNNVYELNTKTLNLAATAIMNGKLVVGPSRSNYNIMCNPFDIDAIKRVFSVKQRTKFGPLTVAIYSLDDLTNLVKLPNDYSIEKLKSIWPSELTIIFEKKADFPHELTCGASTVGITLQGPSALQTISEICKHPIAVTSANLSGQGNSIVSIDIAKAHVGDRVDMIIDGGSMNTGKTNNIEGNSIVDLTFGQPILVRQGLVPIERLRKFFFDLNENTAQYKDMLLTRAGL